MSLDPKQKYLIQDKTNRIYIYSDALAKRKDMRLLDPETGEKSIPKGHEDLVPIELRDRTFQVDPNLKELIDEMRGQLNDLVEGGFEQQINKLQRDFDAKEERLTTDIVDLQEQLNVAMALLKENNIEVPKKEDKKKSGPKTKDK